MPTKAAKSSHAKRKAPRQTRAKATFDSIKIATTELARVNGFAALNTIQIAARAGVSVGSLYQYFPNRESIFLSLFEDTTAKLVEAMKARVPQILDAPLERAIHKTASDMLSLYKTHQLILLELPQQMPELHLSAHSLSFDQLIHGTLRLFLTHRKIGESPQMIEHRAFFIENILIGSIQRYLTRPPSRLPIKLFLRHVTAITVDYIERPMAAIS